MKEIIAKPNRNRRRGINNIVDVYYSQRRIAINAKADGPMASNNKNNRGAV